MMKLIIINGACGVGKSTLTQKIHHLYPLSFLLEIDDQRRYISGYRELNGESKRLSLTVSEAIVDAYLNTGHDVIIDKFLTEVNVVEKFFAIGRKYNADVYEFILNAPKEIVIKRANARGYKTGGLLTPEKVEILWDEIQKYIAIRPEENTVNVGGMSEEEIFQYIQSKIV